jgi:uncharacterized delta-60 repeat protein
MLSMLGRNNRLAIRIATVCSAILLSGLATAAAGHAATPGTLDKSFGSGGIAATGGVRLFASAVQGDGKIVVAGESGVATGPDVFLARFTASGALDRSFGSGGVAHGPAVAGSQGSLARGVAIQPDGKLVVVGKGTDSSGYARNGILVERFNANGSLDTGFGSGGVVNVAANSFGDGYAVAIQAGGKIVATGSIDAAGGGGGVYPRVAVVRLNPNGSLDTSLRGGGVDVVDLGAFSYALSVALQGDGKIVIGGSQAPGLQVPNALIARLTSAGAVDWAVAKQYAIGAASSTFNSVAIQPNGAIVGGGAASSGQTGAVAFVARFTGAGQPDGSFGSGGVAYSPSAINFNQTAEQAVPGISGLVVARNGDLVGAGTYINSTSSSGALWAFTSRGAPDGSFGSHGSALLPVGSNGVEFAALGVSPVTGDLLATGDYWPLFTQNYTGLVAAYFGFGAPPTAPLKLSVNGVSRVYKTSTVAKQGLRLTAGCNQACTLNVSLNASAAVAKQLGIKTTFRSCTRSHGHTRCRKVRGYRPIVITSQKATLRGAGSKLFVLRLSPSYARALAKQRAVRLTLRVAGTSSITHKVSVTNQTVTFTR